MEASKRSPASVMEHVFTHRNPTTGSTPPEHMAWVVFEHGTAFFSAPSDELPLDATPEEILAAARIAMAELGPVIAGTAAGDFNPVCLDAWFPGEFVYFVTYDHPAIATVVIADHEDDLSAGLAGRAYREADLAGLTATEIRGFDGRVVQPRPD
ncbi:MAG TPA: hypothetical protein VGB85_30300 [Nannocystis sp.]|jgi:hypothetical protein